MVVHPSIILESTEILQQLVASIRWIEEGNYTKKNAALKISSVGEHTRHIIESFQELDKGFELGEINYENRPRNAEIENNRFVAITCLETIIAELSKPNKCLKLAFVQNGRMIHVDTTYERELLYTIDHCVHHQAIIKILLNSFGVNGISDTFGVAKSTLRHKEICAQ
jgi:hypothetical protein